MKIEHIKICEMKLKEYIQKIYTFKYIRKGLKSII